MSTNLPIEYFTPSRDPTIPGPDQYGDVSPKELPTLCLLWRIGALYSRLRERPDEFRREFDKIVGRHDMASRVIKGVANAVAIVHSSSPYFFLEDQFADLTEILGRACDERGIDSQPIHEFFKYLGADLKAAIRAVEHLERRLKREGFDLPAAHPEPENKERDVPLGEQRAENQQGSGDPQNIVLVLNRGSLRASWGNKVLDINQHADYTILDLLHKSFGKIVYYPELWRALKPKLVNANIDQMKDAPSEVKDAVSHIRKALKTAGAPFKIKTTRTKGFMMTNLHE